MAKAKARLDQLLLEQGLVASRNVAQALIMRGKVLVDGVCADKPGEKFPLTATIEVKEDSSKYVSRGGYKLEGALQAFSLNVQSAIAIDVGSSTGGFTDCLLQHGAAKVYAVDVGTNQFNFRLKQDERVVLFEQTHVKEIVKTMFSPLPNFAVVDLSFISLRKVLQYIVWILEKPATLVCLVKPQFELEPELVEKGGVVRSKQSQDQAIELVKESGVNLGLRFMGVVPSDLVGAKKGNQEYFIHFVTE
jgi:23S rRNA (cytidine1920-2'-O)/16S rRNA (cytidine1409-2'-O)-methyltransferase